MKSKFKEFYVDEEINFKSLDESVLIVFDTNVLLNIFRYSNETRDILIKSIESVKPNVWIPYHVALEYNLNKRNIIENMRSLSTKTNDLIDKKKESFQKDLANILDEIGIRSKDEKSIRKSLKEEITNQLDTVIADWKKEINNREFSLISDNEDKSNYLAEILDGCVGDCYNQTRIDEIEKDGEDRFNKNIPPGYKDATDKQKQSHVYHGEITYQKKYGDLIFWQQILEKAKDEKIKKVLLVSDEEKEDWVYKYAGKIIGPQIQLIAELKNISSADLYFMNTNKFISQINNEEFKEYVDNSFDSRNDMFSFYFDDKNISDIKNNDSYMYPEELEFRLKEFSSKVTDSLYYAQEIRLYLTNKISEKYRESFEISNKYIKNSEGKKIISMELDTKKLENKIDELREVRNKMMENEERLYVFKQASKEYKIEDILLHEIYETYLDLKYFVEDFTEYLLTLVESYELEIDNFF